MQLIRKASLLIVLAVMTSAVSAAVIGPGYTQNFNAMGTGTAYLDGWAGFSVAGSHDLFTPSDDVAPVVTTVGLPTGAAIITAGTTAVTTLTAATPGTQKDSTIYNWAVGGSATERSLGTSPSGIAGSLLQLTLTNNQAGPITDLSISYDTRVFTTTVLNNSSYSADTAYANGTIEELPGYWLFYSLNNGSTWTNVSALNPNGHTWANSIGTVNESIADLTLSSPWAAGSTIKFWWFDDNAQGPSPDQLIGLDNVVITPVSPAPEPASLVICALGGLGLFTRRRTLR